MAGGGKIQGRNFVLRLCFPLYQPLNGSHSTLPCHFKRGAELLRRHVRLTRLLVQITFSAFTLDVVPIFVLIKHEGTHDTLPENHKHVVRSERVKCCGATVAHLDAARLWEWLPSRVIDGSRACEWQGIDADPVRRIRANIAANLKGLVETSPLEQ